MSRVNVMQPWLGAEEVAAVTEVIESGWVAQGPRVAEFERRFAETQQAEHAVAVSSCTTGLHLALIVAGVGPGDDVVLPSYSFIATANVAMYVGARPVFADVDPVTGNITHDSVEAVLTEKTRAVIAVDQGGVPVDLETIRAVCDPRGIVVIEDAACAAGSTYHGRPVGAGAEIAAWSFHPRKILTTGEGGMITTSRADWADRARRLREHAMSVSAAERHTSVISAPEEYTEVGFNFRMTDLQAAVGIVQLGRLPEVVDRRRALAASYSKAIEEIDGLRAVADPGHGTSNFQSFWVEITPDYPLHREGLLLALAEADISARRGIMASHRQPAYTHLEAELPVTERLTDNTLILPLFHQMSDSDQARVIDALRLAPSQSQIDMPDLILVAASGLAREVLALLRSCGDDRRIQVVDDDPRLWGMTIGGVPVTGGLEVVRGLADHELLICAGRGTARRAISARLRELGVSPHRYTRVVHPSVNVPDDCEIGAGSVLLAHTALTSNVRLGKHVVVMPNTSLTHDVVVEDCATICAGVSLGGNVHVETGAYLGMNASVREGLRVGADSVLGMGAALVVDLPPGQVWGGNPASRLRTSAATSAAKPARGLPRKAEYLEFARRLWPRSRRRKSGVLTSDECDGGPLGSARAYALRISGSGPAYVPAPPTITGNGRDCDMTQQIPLVDLSLQTTEVELEVTEGIAEVIRSGAYVLGPQVVEFESAYAAFCGVSHCVGVGNGTDAIELALRGAGVGAGDDVIIPANTFVATAEAVVRSGANLVLADCDEDFLLDPGRVAESVTPRTRAVIGVDLYGQIAPFEALAEVLPSDVRLMEDAAQSQGATRHGVSAGAFGVAAATSFYPGKNLGAFGDAGAVTTADDEIADRIRSLRSHGGQRRYEHVLLGTNSRLDSIQAVALSAKLRRLVDWNKQRSEAADRYAQLLANVPGIRLPRAIEGNTHVWHLYVVRVPQRDRVLDYLLQAGIGAGLHYPTPINLLPPFVHLGLDAGSFPIAERLADEILSLPIFPGISVSQQDRVVEVLRDALAHVAQ